MHLQCIATGSSGNAYILTFKSGRALLLDAGVKCDRIMKALGARWPQLGGVLITHEHNDHVAAVKDLVKLGVQVYASPGTIKAVGVQGIIPAIAGQAFGVKGSGGAWAYVYPFHVKHDAAEPMGFLIRDPETGERLVYATDFSCKTTEDYKRFKIPGVHYWLVECNYSEHLIDPDDIKDERSMRCHMGMNMLERVLAGNDMRAARKIVLCHLSSTRADEAMMITRIGELTGVPTIAADKGVKVDLDLAPF